MPCYDPGTMQYLGDMPAMKPDEVREWLSPPCRVRYLVGDPLHDSNPQYGLLQVREKVNRAKKAAQVSGVRFALYSSFLACCMAAATAQPSPPHGRVQVPCTCAY